MGWKKILDGYQSTTKAGINLKSAVWQNDRYTIVFSECTGGGLDGKLWNVTLQDRVRRKNMKSELRSSRGDAVKTLDQWKREYG